MTKDITLYDLLTLSSYGKIGPRGYEKLTAIGHSGKAKLRPESKEDSRQAGMTLNKMSAQQMVEAGIKQEIANEFVAFREQFDVEAEIEKLEKLGIVLITQTDQDYPPLLKEISDPPFLLYIKGNIRSLHRQSLAVVGSRKHTHYSPAIVERVVPDLVAGGVTIVSGLALGVDGLAHKATLAAGGVTVAIIGCGLDVIYPREHRVLADNIVENGGAIISEYPLGTPPLKQHFPARNRLIAGVSGGTLIIECDIQSGAMITAHHALEQNREVYAVPGPITSLSSAGPNALLRMGAHVVTSPEDLLEHLGLPSKKKTSTIRSGVSTETLPETEQAVFQLLSHEPIHIDLLVEASTLSTAEVNSSLLFLEMKGLIRNVGAAQYVRR